MADAIVNGSPIRFEAFYWSADQLFVIDECNKKIAFVMEACVMCGNLLHTFSGRDSAMKTWNVGGKCQLNSKPLQKI